MKYLMLYESFDSKVVNKVNKFLAKKVGVSASNDFIKSLKEIQGIYDFPISRVKDSDISYMPSKKAALIKAPKDWEGYDWESDVYAFKFWFSLENGFLGKTGIGSKEMKFSNEGNNKTFSETELEYIKNTLGIKKGDLKPVNDYSKLYSGKEVIGYFSEYSEFRNLSKATIFIDSPYIYAIQDVSSGGEPSMDGWSRYGEYSWSLGRENDPSYDHKKLHTYEKSGRDLNIISYKEDNILNWNLPVDESYLKSWEGNDPDIIENSDFCIMFKIDDVIKSGYKKLSTTRKERVESKKDATALYTDKEIKNLNIERYMTALIDKMGISKKSKFSDLKKLEKVIKIAICFRYPIYSQFSSRGFLRLIDIFSERLTELIKYNDEYSLTSIRERLIEMNSDSLKKLNLYKKSEEIILGSNDKLLTEIFEKISVINKKITNYINNQDIETLSDLQSIKYKLDYISNIFNDEITGRLKIDRILKNMGDVEIIEEYINRFVGYDGLEEDIKKIKNIERYIDSILN